MDIQHQFSVRHAPVLCSDVHTASQPGSTPPRICHGQTHVAAGRTALPRGVPGATGTKVGCEEPGALSAAFHIVSSCRHSGLPALPHTAQRFARPRLPAATPPAYHVPSGAHTAHTTYTRAPRPACRALRGTSASPDSLGRACSGRAAGTCDFALHFCDLILYSTYLCARCGGLPQGRQQYTFATSPPSSGLSSLQATPTCYYSYAGLYAHTPRSTYFLEHAHA